MDYLRGNATASAVGLFLIYRHLVESPEGLTEDQLRDSLQPLRSRVESGSERGDVLASTLAVGKGIQVLNLDKASGQWTADTALEARAKDTRIAWQDFRGPLLTRVIEAGLASRNGNGKLPDLVLGLAWFLQLNPMHPVREDWARGPEPLVSQISFESVGRSEQWRPFVRWAVALGLANRSQPKVVIPDATTAVMDQLEFLPASAKAQDWLLALRERLPILGAPEVTRELPQGRAWEPVPPSLCLALLKLEKSGSLRMDPSDDASDVVAIALGEIKRQVGRIEVLDRD